MAKALPRGIILRDWNALEEYNRLRAELGEEFRAIQTDLAASGRLNSSKSPDGNDKLAGAVFEAGGGGGREVISRLMVADLAILHSLSTSRFVHKYRNRFLADCPKSTQIVADI